MRKINHMPAEARGNVVVLSFAFAWLAVVIITIILGKTGIYKIDVGPFAIPTAITSFVLLDWILAANAITEGKFIESPRLKYILLFIVSMLTFVFNVMAFFHTTLILIMPFLLAIVYRSKRFNYVAITSSLILVAITPMLAYSLHAMEPSFPLWYLSMIKPEWVSEEGLAELARISNVSRPGVALAIYVSLPRILIVFVMAVLVIFSTDLNIKSHERKNNQVRSMQNDILDGMAAVIENRDSFTGGHIIRTRSAIAVLVKNAKHRFAFPEEYWENLVKAAAMHDVGKISVSDTILNKPAKLNENEFEVIKGHPTKSVEIIDTVLGPIEDDYFLKIARNIALYHHERYDGTGYPEGLTGDEIPFEARLMSLADVFDALVSKRPYKAPFSFGKAYSIIIGSMGKQFDPKLLDVFKDSFPELREMYSE